MSQAEHLRRAGRNPDTPLRLVVEGFELRVDAWLRVLPGKRLVGRGEYRGRAVLAKLFVGDRAAQHAERERAGLRALNGAGVATPELIEGGTLEGGGAFVLTEFLTEAIALQTLWDRLPNPMPGDAAAMGLLRRALAAIAAMHAGGLLQGDLHLGNFLQSGDELLVIDGDAVENVSPGTPLAQGAVERNLGLFFAQLPPAWDACRELLLLDYLQFNSHRAIDPERLERWVAKLRSKRLEDYLHKTLRDCSLFAVERNWRRFTSVWRARRDGLSELLHDPDQAFSGELLHDPDQAFSGELLKDGGSSTVAKWSTGGQNVLVKRYNIKGLGHWLQRFWRPSRAWHAWQAGHRLRFLGLATPEPLAMVESRFGPLRRRAWLVTAFSPGQQLLGLLGDGSSLPPPPLAAAILGTFTRLHAARISHGDCKATNFLWDGQQLLIIDLDAMRAHSEGGSWQRAWSTDRQRLLRNWPADSAVSVWLDEHLPR